MVNLNNILLIGTANILEICNRDFIEALHQLIDIYSWSSHV